MGSTAAPSAKPSLVVTKPNLLPNIQTWVQPNTIKTSIRMHTYFILCIFWKNICTMFICQNKERFYKEIQYCTMHKGNYIQEMIYISFQFTGLYLKFSVSMKINNF